MKVDVLIATYGRAERLPGLIANLRDTAPDAAPIFVCDHGDAASREALDGQRVLLHDGSYPQKVNAAFLSTFREIAQIAADDVIFHPGWMEAMLAAFADPLIGMVGTNDLSPMSNPIRSTHVAVRRSYILQQGGSYEEPGKIYHEGYHHNFTENEICGLANHRKAWAYAPDAILEHHHPAWGSRPLDATDRRGNQSGWNDDEKLFYERLALWHPTV